MDKRIIIPTDFSKNALNAARYALDLYAKLNCEFYFLNVFQLVGYTTTSLNLPEPGSSPYEAAKDESEEGLNKLLAMLRLHYENPKHTFHTISSFNFLLEAIQQTISKKDIDIVVMGTQGASGSKGVIFGSNTVNTMEKITTCPVLAIPENVTFSPLKEIVFPTNYKNNFKRLSLYYLIEIANMHHAEIQILYIESGKPLSAKQEENKELLDTILASVAHEFQTLSGVGVAEGITAFVESRHSDMIAFLNKKHFFFGSIFSKPLIKEIGYSATTPILALNEL